MTDEVRFVFYLKDGPKDSLSMSREELLEVIRYLMQERDSLREECKQWRDNFLSEKWV